LHFQDKIKVGVRVVRGADWYKGNEDGGEGNVGTVVEILDDFQQVRVQWDSQETLDAEKNGDIYNYRTGQDKKYDLKLFDNAQAGKTYLTNKHGLEKNISQGRGLCVVIVIPALGQNSS
jgi:hypothetical protein